MSSEFHEDFFGGPLILLRVGLLTAALAIVPNTHWSSSSSSSGGGGLIEAFTERGPQGSDGKIGAQQRRLDEKLFSRLFRKAKTGLYRGKLWFKSHVVGASPFLGRPASVPPSCR
jgi:hypothetical protein